MFITRLTGISIRDISQPFLVTPSSERVNYLITLENVEQSIIKQTMALNRVKHLRLSV